MKTKNMFGAAIAALLLLSNAHSEETAGNSQMIGAWRCHDNPDMVYSFFPKGRSIAHQVYPGQGEMWAYSSWGQDSGLTFLHAIAAKTIVNGLPSTGWEKTIPTRKHNDINAEFYDYWRVASVSEKVIVFSNVLETNWNHTDTFRSADPKIERCTYDDAEFQAASKILLSLLNH